MAKDITTSALSFVSNGGIISVVSTENGTHARLGVVVYDGKVLEGVFAEIEPGAISGLAGDHSVASLAVEGVAARDVVLKKWIAAANENKRLQKAGAATVLLLTLAACKGEGTLIELSNPHLTIDSTNIGADAVRITTSVADVVIDVISETDGADEYTAITVNADGPGNLTFTFEDGQDVVYLTPESTITGFDTITVQEGTVDFAFLDIDPSKISIGSTAMLNYSQFMTIPTVTLRSGATSGTVIVTVTNVADAIGVNEAAEVDGKIQTGIDFVIRYYGDLTVPELQQLLDGGVAISDLRYTLEENPQGTLDILDTTTASSIQSLLDAGMSLDNITYSLEDGPENLLGIANTILNNADGVFVLGEATVAQIQALLDAGFPLDRLSFSIADDAAAITGGSDAILAAATATTVSGGLTVAELQALLEAGVQLDDISYNLEDTAENLVAAPSALISESSTVTVDGVASVAEIQSLLDLGVVATDITFELSDTPENLMGATSGLVGLSQSVAITGEPTVEQIASLVSAGASIEDLTYDLVATPFAFTESTPLIESILAGAASVQVQMSDILSDPAIADAELQSIMSAILDSGVDPVDLDIESDGEALRLLNSLDGIPQLQGMSAPAVNIQGTNGVTQPVTSDTILDAKLAYLVNSVQADIEGLNGGSFAPDDYTTIKQLNDAIKLLEEGTGVTQAIANATAVLNDAIDVLSASVDEQVAALQSQLDTAEGVSATNAAEISDLFVLVDTLDSVCEERDAEQTAALDAAVTTLTAAISDLTSQVTTQVSNLQGSISDNSTDILSNATAISVINIDLTELRALVSANNTSQSEALAQGLADLDAELLAADADIEAAIQTVADGLADAILDIDANSADIVTNSALIAGLDEALATLAETVSVDDASLLQTMSDMEGALNLQIYNLTDDLANNVNDLQAQIDSNDSDIAANAGQIVDILQVIANLQGSVSGGSSETSTALTTLETTLTGQIEALTTELATQVATLSTAITANESAAQTNATDIASNVTSITSLTATLASLQSAVMDNEFGLMNLEMRLQDELMYVQMRLDSDIYYLSDQVTSYVDSLSADINSNTTDILSNASDISILDGALSTLQSLVSSNDAEQTTALNSAVTTLNATITALENVLNNRVAALETSMDALLVDIGNATIDTIAGLSTQLELLTNDAITDPEADGYTDGLPTVNSIAGLQAALSAIQSGGTPALDAVIDTVGAPANPNAEEGDADYAATGIFATLATLEEQLTAIQAVIAPEGIQGTELNDFIQLYPYASQPQTIRVEGGEGDDVFNSANVNTQLVGGEGADTINLTWKDTSADTIVFQSIYDGESVPAVSLTFSTLASDYREGSVLRVTIDSTEYSYTVTNAAGDTVADALEGLVGAIETGGAPILSATVDAATGVITMLGDGDVTATGGYGANEAIVNTGRALEKVVSFSSDPQDWPALTNGSNTTEFARQISVTIGESTPTVYNVFLADGVTADTELNTADAAAVRYSTDFQIGGVIHKNSVLGDGTVDSRGSTIESAGTAANIGELLAELNLAYEGLATFELGGNGNLVVSVRYPNTLQDADGNDVAVAPASPFVLMGVDAELTTTVDVTYDASPELSGVKKTTDGSLPTHEIAADIVYDQNGDVDIAASLAALQTAIGDANGTGGSIEGMLDSVTVDGTSLVLVGSGFGDDSRFEITSAAIEQNGAQQKTVVSFSADAADYYDGGTISVEVEGVLFEAEMVAGDPSASLASLKAVVEAANMDVAASVTILTNNTLSTSSVSGTFSGAYPGGADITVNGEVWRPDLASATTELRFDYTHATSVVWDGSNWTAVDGSGTAIDLATSGAIVKSTTSPWTFTSVGYAGGTFGTNWDYMSYRNTAEAVEIGGLDASGAKNFQGMWTDGNVTGMIIREDSGGSYILFTDGATGLTNGADATASWTGGSYSDDGRVPDVTTSNNLPVFNDGAVLSDLISHFNTQFAGEATMAFDVENQELTITADVPGAGTTIVLHDFVFWDGDVNGLDSRLYADSVAVVEGADRVLTLESVATHSDAIDWQALSFTASTEEADQLLVDASMTYAGEKQTATFSLQGVTEYTEYSYDIDTNGDQTPDAPSRPASVYYDNGVAYLTVADADGNNAVTVQQAMVTRSLYEVALDGTGTSNLNSTQQAAWDAVDDTTTYGAGDISLTLRSSTADSAPFEFTHVTRLTWTGTTWVTSGSGSLVDSSVTGTVNGPATLLFNGNVGNGGAYAAYPAGNSGIIVTASNTNPSTGGLYTSALEHFNGAWTNGVVNGMIIRDDAYGNYYLVTNGATNLSTNTDVTSSWQGEVGVVGSGSFSMLPGVLETFTSNDGETLANFLTRVATDSSYIDDYRLNAVAGADGKVVLELNDSQALPIEFRFSVSGVHDLIKYAPTLNDDLGQLTSKALVDTVNAQIATDPNLSALIESASFDSATGDVVLTASNFGSQTFKVADVTMDYEGVQQIATIALEDALNYSQNSLGDDVAGNGASVYFESGMVKVSIASAGSQNTWVLDVPMSWDVGYEFNFDMDWYATNYPEVLFNWTERQSSDVLTDGEFYLYLAGQLFTSNANETIGQFLARVETSFDLIKEITFNDASVADRKLVIKYDQDMLSTYFPNGFSQNNDGIIFQDNSWMDNGYAYRADLNDDLSGQTSDSIVAAINALTLSDTTFGALVEGASYDSATGEITIVSKETGENLFSVVDVAMDYAGNKQIATVSLDPNGVRDSSYVDGAIADGQSYSRGPDSYYKDGKAYLTIMDLSNSIETIIAVDMAQNPNGPAAFTSWTDPIALEQNPAAPGVYTSFMFDFSDDLPYAGGQLKIAFGTSLNMRLADGTSFEIRRNDLNYAGDIAVFDLGRTFTSVDEFVIALNNNISVAAQERGGISGSDVPKVSYTITSSGDLVFDVSNGAGIKTQWGSSFRMTSTTLAAGEYTAELTGQALVDEINAQTGIGGSLEGLIGQATLDGTTITLESADNVRSAFAVSDITLDYAGQNQIATATFSVDDADYYTGGEIIVTIDATPADDTDAVNNLSLTVAMQDADALGSLKAVMAAIDAKITSDSAWSAILSHATLDTATGEITLVSKDKAVHQFSIADVVASEDEVFQEATASFSATDADYFAGGQIGLTLNGETISVAMVENDAATTLEDLRAAIATKIGEVQALTDTLSATVTVDGGTITVTAKTAVDGYGEINISEVQTGVAAQNQITSVQITENALPTSIVGVESQPQMSIDIAGTTIYAEAGATAEASAQNLAQAIIEARDGVFAETSVASNSVQAPAEVRIALPDGVTLDTILANNGLSSLSEGRFDIEVTGGEAYLSYGDFATLVGSGRSGTIGLVLNELQSQLGDSATVLFDVGTNEVVITSTATGPDAYVDAYIFELSNFYEDVELAAANSFSSLSDNRATNNIAAQLADLTNVGGVAMINPDGSDKNLVQDGQGFQLGLSLTGSSAREFTNSDFSSNLVEVEVALYIAAGTAGQNPPTVTLMSSIDGGTTWTSETINTPFTTSHAIAKLNALYDQALTNAGVDPNLGQFFLGGPNGTELYITNTTYEPAVVELDLGVDVVATDYVPAGEEITYDITFNDGAARNFTGTISVSTDMTLADIADALNTRLTQFETANGSDQMGTITFDAVANAFVITTNTTDELSVTVNSFSMPVIYDADLGTISGTVDESVDSLGSASIIYDGASDLAADTPLSMDVISGTITYAGGSVDISFTPELAVSGPGTGSTVGDFLTYLEGLAEITSASIVDGNIMIVPADTSGAVSASFAIKIQTADFVQQSYDAGSTTDAGTAAIQFEAAQEAVMEVTLANVDDATVFEGYSVQLTVDGTPYEATASNGFSGGIADVVAELNEQDGAFDGVATFAWVDGKLVATSVSTGVAATIDFTSAVMVVNAASYQFRVGEAVEDPVTGVDEVAFVAATDASVLLDGFQGLAAGAPLAQGDYNFSLEVNGTVVSGTYTAPDPVTTPGTVADFVAEVNTALSGVAIATLTSAGLRITTTVSGADQSITVVEGDLALDVVRAPVTALSSTVGTVDFTTTVVDGTTVVDITLGGANAGPDEMSVQNYSYETENVAAGTAQTVSLQFTNTLDSASSVAEGSIFSVTVDGVETQLKLWNGDGSDDLSDYAGQYFDLGSITGDRSEAIVQGIAEAIKADHNLVGSDGQDTDLGEVNVTGNTIELVASRNGLNLLGTVDDGNLALSVTSAANTPISVGFMEVLQNGAIVFNDVGSIAPEDCIILSVQDGRAEGTLSFTDTVDVDGMGSGGATSADDYVLTIGGSEYQGSIDDLFGMVDIDDTAVLGDDTDYNSVSYENPNSGWDTTGATAEATTGTSDYYGDTPLTGADGIQQDYQNTTDGRTDMVYDAEGGDATFYGDAESIIADGGEGVTQTYVNPTDGYTATDNSPVAGSTTTGDVDYQGDAALTGVDGLTQDYTNPTDGYTAADESPRDGVATDGDATLVGVDGGYYTADGFYADYMEGTTSAPDRFVYSLAGVSDAAITAGTITFSNGSDSYTATFNDVDGEEGLFAELAAVSFVDTLTVDEVAGEIVVTTTGEGSYFEVSIDLTFADDSTLVDSLRSYGYQIMNVDATEIEGAAETFETDVDSVDDALEVSTSTEAFNPFTDEADVLTLAGGSANPDVVVNFQPGTDAIAIEGDLAAATLVETADILEDAGSFDLSTVEFGLVGSANNALSISDIQNSTAVAALLEDFFDFAGTANNGDLNSTVFGVTSGGDSTLTTIWAHTQSTADDSTIDGLELNLLAVVDSRSDEFEATDFLIWNGAAFGEPEILV